MQVAAREIATLPRGGVVPGEWWGFWIEALNDGVVISTDTTTPGDDMYDCQLESSSNGGRTWQPFYESVYDDGSHWTASVTLPKAHDRLCLRAGSNDNTAFTDIYSDAWVNLRITNGNVKVGGNILSLLTQRETTEFPIQGSSSLNPLGGFFRGQPILDFSELLLTATVLIPNAYRALFRNCRQLITPPYLPPATLANDCYASMFAGCTALASAPSLPATSLAKECYFDMFNGCTALTSAPSLPATLLAEGCYSGMFRDCTSLAAAPSVSATSTALSCCARMFAGCTSLTSSPILLTEWPRGSHAYEYMFQNCSHLSSIKTYQRNWPPSGTPYWVSGVASTGTFYCPSALGTNSTIQRGNHYCPNGWTVVNI